MRWIMVAVCLAAACVLGFFFTPAFGSFLERCLSRYCYHQFGFPLEASGRNFENGLWVFQEPRVRLRGAGLTADQCSVQAAFDPWQRLLDLSIAIDHPCVRLSPEQGDLKTALENKVRRLFPDWLLQIRVQCSVKNGKIQWMDLQEERSADFECNWASCGNDWNGQLMCWLDRADHGTNLFELNGRRQGSQFPEMDFRMAGVEIPRWAGLCTAFGFARMPSRLSSGKMDGAFHLVYSKHQLPEIFGEAAIEDLRFGHADSMGEVEAPAVKISLGTSSPSPGIDLVCSWEKAGQEGARIQVALRSLGVMASAAEVRAVNIGPFEWDLLQSVCGIRFPEVRRFELLQGNIQADAIAYFEGYRLTDLQVDRIEGASVGWRDSVQGSFLFLEGLSGTFSLDFSQMEPVNSLKGSFETLNGDFSTQIGNGYPVRISDFSSRIACAEGKASLILHNALENEAHVKLEVDWNRPGECLKCDYQGSGSGLLRYFPEGFGGKIDRILTAEQIRLGISCGRVGTHTAVSGNLGLEADRETIAFGFEWSPIGSGTEEDFDAEPVNRAIRAGLVPPIGFPLLWLRSEMASPAADPPQIEIRNGWFKARGLALDRVAEILPFEEVRLSGIVDAEGTFDHRSLAVRYQGSDCRLETKAFGCRIKPGDGHGCVSFSGCQCYNLITHACYGMLEVSNASVFDKVHGLEVSQAEAHLFFDPPYIHLLNLSACCNGVDAAGRMSVDFSRQSLGEYRAQAAIVSLKGSLGKIGALARIFDPAIAAVELPVDGYLNLRSDSGAVQVSLNKSGYRMEGQWEGYLVDSTVWLPHFSLKITDLSARYTLNFSQKRLDLSRIRGGLALNEETGRNTLRLFGESLKWHDFTQGAVSFDAAVGDSSSDFLRLAGATTARKEPNGAASVLLHLDHRLSHFKNVHPSAFELAFRQGTIESFRLGMDWHLEDLLDGIQALGQSGLISPGKALSQKLRNIKRLQGDMQLELSYHGGREEWMCRIAGKDVFFNHIPFRDCFLKVRRRSGNWWIDSLKTEDLEASGRLEKDTRDWILSDCRITYGNILELDFEGRYSKATGNLECKVERLEADLAGIKNWGGGFEAIARTYDPHGRLQAQGTFEIDLGGHCGSWRGSGLLYASLSRWDICGLHFQDVQHLACQINSDRGIVFKDFKGQMATPAGRVPKAVVSFEKAGYEFAKGELWIENLAFHIPAPHLRWCSDHLAQNFPQWITPEIHYWLQTCKNQGGLEGVIQYESLPPHNSLELKLSDGKYVFGGREYEVKDVMLEFNPHQCRCQGQYRQGSRVVWAAAHSSMPGFRQGELYLSDTPFTQGLGSDGSIRVEWENTLRQGLQVRKAEGGVRGIACRLQPEPVASIDHLTSLVGTVRLDAALAADFFPSPFEGWIQEAKLGGICQMEGRWQFNTGKGDAFPLCSFEGTLQMDEGSFKGHAFDLLRAGIVYSPKGLEVYDLSIKDPFGELSCAKILMDPEGSFEIPSLEVRHFKPGFLAKHSMGSQMPKSAFTIKEAVLNDFKGRWDLPDGWSGRGSVRFHHRKRGEEEKGVFRIPENLVAAIGFEPALLTPVSGVVEYNLEGGQIRLTKLKDVYSDKKRSKFSLSPDIPSYIDWNGNLHLSVRVRPNALLFKLAELLTFKIEGNVSHPRFSLQIPKGGEVYTIQ